MLRVRTTALIWCTARGAPRDCPTESALRVVRHSRLQVTRAARVGGAAPSSHGLYREVSRRALWLVRVGRSGWR